jgi:rhamnosyl/mannosyltransferase
MIRVCHLGKYYPPAVGGIETLVCTLARAQAALGLGVSVACINHRRGPTAVERDGAVEVVRLGRVGTVAKFDICPDLGRQLARIEADLLHLHVPNPTMIVGLLRSRTQLPLVVTYHSDLVRQRLLGQLFRPIERLAYRRVHTILTTSPDYAAGSEFLRSLQPRLRVLPYGLDLRPYLEPSAETRTRAAWIREQYGRKGPIWLSAGRQVYYKGLINAVRALTRVVGTLILIGDGPDQPKLRAEAERLGVRNRVVFLGPVPHFLDVVPYYLAADAYWFPSNLRSEAFGLVQVESMASGCPVINTRIPHSGVPWVSPHEETGLTVPVNDPEALAEAARRLITEPGLRDRLAAAGRERALREFDHRVMAERLLDIYRHVLTGSEIPRPAPPPVLIPTRSS